MSVGNGVPFFGYDSAIAVAKETAYGTFVTASSFIEFLTESIKVAREEIKLESINNSRDYSKRMIGNESVEGSIEAHLNVASDGIVNIIKQAIGGTVSSAVVVGGVEYLHTLYPGDMENNKATTTATDMKGLSFIVRRGTTAGALSVFNYSGMRVNNLTIKGEVGQPIMITADMIGKGMSLSSTCPTVALSDVLPVNFTGITIKTGDSLSSVSTEYFKSFEFTLANNIDAQRFLGSRQVGLLPPIKRDVTLKLAQNFDTMTSFNRFFSNTVTSISIIGDSQQTIGAGSTTYSFQIDLPNCYFNSNQPEVKGSGVLEYSLDVRAMRNASIGSTFQMFIRNGTANYE
jgi:hypothetical protein